MVLKSSRQRSLTIIIVALIVIAISVFGLFFTTKSALKTAKDAEDTQTSATQDNSTPTTPEPQQQKTAILNLQPVVTTWAKSHPKAGVFIYDLNNHVTVAKYRPTNSIYVASIYKLWVVYYGYLMNSTKNGNYDAECLDLAIRKSDSACAEALWNKIGRDTLQSWVNKQGFKNTVLTNATSTPEDVAKILQLFYEHSDFPGKTWDKIKDSFINQPAKFRRGLPSGFSKDVTVLNKVGWLGNEDGEWEYFSDAAIIEIKNHDYAVVVINPGDFSANATLAKSIEQAIKGSK